MDNYEVIKECERLNKLYGNPGFKPFPEEKVKKYFNMEDTQQLVNGQGRSEPSQL